MQKDKSTNSEMQTNLFGCWCKQLRLVYVHLFNDGSSTAQASPVFIARLEYCCLICSRLAFVLSHLLLDWSIAVLYFRDWIFLFSMPSGSPPCPDCPWGLVRSSLSEGLAETWSREEGKKWRRGRYGKARPLAATARCAWLGCLLFLCAVEALVFVRNEVNDRFVCSQSGVKMCV